MANLKHLSVREFHAITESKKIENIFIDFTEFLGSDKHNKISQNIENYIFDFCRKVFDLNFHFDTDERYFEIDSYPVIGTFKVKDNTGKILRFELCGYTCHSAPDHDSNKDLVIINAMELVDKYPMVDLSTNEPSFEENLELL